MRDHRRGCAGPAAGAAALHRSLLALCTIKIYFFLSFCILFLCLFSLLGWLGGRESCEQTFFPSPLAAPSLWGGFCGAAGAVLAPAALSLPAAWARPWSAKSPWSLPSTPQNGFAPQPKSTAFLGALRAPSIPEMLLCSWVFGGFGGGAASLGCLIPWRTRDCGIPTPLQLRVVLNRGHRCRKCKGGRTAPGRGKRPKDHSQLRAAKTPPHWRVKH